MNFHEGDTVMHWTYGLGQIISLEERDLLGLKTLYLLCGPEPGPDGLVAVRW